MEKWLSGIEEGLPQWLNKPETQWVQWVYVIWQLIRCNPLTILVLSYLPFKLRQWQRKKGAVIVVVGDSRDYRSYPGALFDYFDGKAIRWKNIEEVSRHFEEDNPDRPYFFTVKHNNNHYFTHIHPLCDLLKCWQLFGEDIIFVDSLRRISGSLAVGKQLSETEAYEKIFTKRYFCGEGAGLVVPTTLNYVDFSSKFWVLISSLPILLQANNNVKLSALFSLVIILLDFNRGRLYRVYDRVFTGIANCVKVNLFKERTGLYDFFSIFSYRWGYSDSVEKHAYPAEKGHRLKIGYYSKLETPNDIKIVGWERYMADPSADSIFTEIDVDKAHCNLMKWSDMSAVVELNRHVYVF